jgi:hypothetical protein
MAVYGGDTRIVPPADGDITRFKGACSQEQISGDVQVEIKSSNVASLPTLVTWSCLRWCSIFSWTNFNPQFEDSAGGMFRFFRGLLEQI